MKVFFFSAASHDARPEKDYNLVPVFIVDNKLIEINNRYYKNYRDWVNVESWVLHGFQTE